MSRFTQRYRGDTRQAIATDSSVLELVQKIEALIKENNHLKRECEHKVGIIKDLLKERDEWISRMTSEF